MKNILLFVLVFFLSSLIHASGINVTTPDGNDYWNIGETKEIEWRNTLGITTNVKIRLFDKTGNTRILAISDNTNNDGKFDWKIPQSLHEGEYVIRVKTIDNKFFGDSFVFHIQDRAQIKINLTSPSGGSRYLTPGTMLFKWEMQSSHLVENVKLMLKKGGQVKSEIIVRNNGSVTGPLTDNINDGTDYSIRIEDADDPTIFDESGNFEIYHQSSSNINVKLPLRPLFFKDEEIKISWTSNGFDKNVIVRLLRDSSPFKTLAGPTRDNFFIWKINEPKSTHQYQISVSSYGNNNISDISHTFLISGSTDLIVFSKRGIFKKEKFVKGDSTNLRFRVRNPSSDPAPLRVKLNINFYKGKILSPPGISKGKLYARAITKYAGNKISHINPNGDTLFDLPVTINDKPGNYTVVISILPADLLDTIEGNNEIYGYFKVIFKALQFIKKK